MVRMYCDRNPNMGGREGPRGDRKKDKKVAYTGLSSFQLPAHIKSFRVFLYPPPLTLCTHPLHCQSGYVGSTFLFPESDCFSSFWSTSSLSLAWIFAASSYLVLLLSMTFLFLEHSGSHSSSLAVVCSSYLDCGVSLIFSWTPT